MAETFSFEDALQSPAPTPVKQAQTFSFEDAAAPQETEASKTSNPLHGMFGRAAELLGSGAEAVQRVSAPTAEGIQQALPESMRSKYLAPEAIKERQKAFTDEATKYSKDIGYAPSTSLKELGDNPLKVIPFVAERVITSAPDMAGAALAFTPYVMTRANEILNKRLENDKKTYEQATVGDVTAATAAAIAESTLERFATKRILPGGKGIAGAPVAGGAAKRIGKEVGLQSSTEAGEELAGYAGESAGTEKGFDPEEAGLRMLEAGIVGGGLGGATRGGREVYDAAKRQGFSFEEAKPVPSEEKPVATQLEEQPTVDAGIKEIEPIAAPVEREPIIPLSKDAGTISGVDVVETPVTELKLSRDVPQFKAAADEQGVVEPLKGKKYERVGTAPIQIWERLNGDKEVISGRHRFDLARRTGEQTIPTQIFREADGFNADQAAIMDAELNIRDEKGTIKDYVNYFKKTGEFGLQKEDYESRGLLDGKTGQRAYSVSTQGSDELVSALNADRITDEAAHKIVSSAPGDARLQALGLKLYDQKPLSQVVNIIEAAKTIPVKEENLTGDMFGFDDSAMKTAEEMAKIAGRRQRELSSDIKAIEGAGRNPVIAKKYGVDVKDPDAIKQRVAEMKQERSGWDNWASNEDLVDEIRREMSGESPTPKVAKKKEAPELKLEPTEEKTPAQKKSEAAAATEREVKEIADREREVFGLQPQTPETGIGYGMQDDMLGANGLTEQEFKKGIDKNSTEPGEPLVLRNVTLNENIAYNDDVNSKVEDEQTEHYSSVENMKDVEQTEDVEYDLSKQIEAYEEYIELAKQGKVTAKEVMDVAKAEFESGNISKDVFNVIEQAYKNNPAILEGIRLEVGKNKEKFVLGHFQPIARMIRLFKDTSGVIDPETVRHELAHSMEQMMTPDQKAAVVAAWKDELLRASRAEKTEQGKVFFRAVSLYLHNPTKETLRVAQFTMPNITYYQYINPSEYWAVNAEQLMKGQLGSGMDKFKSNMNAMYQGLRSAFGASNFWTGNKVFKQILEGDRFSRRMLVDYVQKTKRRNYKGDAAPLGTWDSRSTNWVEDMKYKYVDKYIDLLRAKQDIERTAGELDDIANAYQKETLSHGRIAKQVQDFTNEEARPLAETMKKNNISQEQLHEYLLARHAEEYNAKIAEINPEMGDSGSSISTQEANDYITSLGEARVKKLDEAAKIVDRMTERTRQYLVDNGLEDDSTIAAWEKTYKYYVPLYRKGLEYTGGGRGVGQGYTSRGAFSKRATGSLKEVKDIMESIAEDRIRAIEKAEKARVGRALYAMAVSNPNPSFWLPINRDAIGNKEKTKAELRKMGLDDELIKNIMQQPKSAKIDSETGLVYYAPDNYVLNSNNVFPVRIDGKDRFIIFNSSDPRASRLISAMKNMDTPDVEGLLRVSAYVTRFFSSVNTQYNPLFGAWNFARDVQGAALNLSTTELRGHEKEVIGKTLSAMRGIYADLRSERKTGKVAKGEWSDLWEDFQKHGGQTGYKAQFVTPKGDFKMIAKEIQNLNKGNVKKVADGVFGWLSDYNDSMENAVRLSAYKVALENGMSKDKAANLAKNLTVNFNRKGANSSLAGSLFAFFNASVQGTSRLYETLSGPMGKKIMFGGFALGVFQAIALELAGFEDDEPPQFVKEKSLVIPLALLTGGKEYISLPMPLGFNIFPGLGRIFMEAVLMANKGKNPSSKFFDALSLAANSFNPLGSSGLSLQTIAPTPLDLLVSLETNKDSFGRPIYREDRATNPQVGYERTRENTSEAWKWIAEQINWMTGGTDFKKGMWSPTGDEISYLAGQVTGGLGRELGKIYGGATDLVTGEDIAPYKIPLLGKLYGDAESKANVSNHFYQNATKLSEIEREIKGRKAPGWKGESAYDYIRRTPEAQLVNQVNRFENEISQLNKRKKELKARGATIQQIKHIEDIKERKMREFNKRYAKYQ